MSGDGFDRLGIAIEVDAVTVAPMFRVNVTYPSDSSRRIASRTGTTLTPSSRAEVLDDEPFPGIVLAVEDRPQDRLVGVIGLGGRGARSALPVSRVVVGASHRDGLLGDQSLSVPVLLGRSTPGPDHI